MVVSRGGWSGGVSHRAVRRTAPPRTSRGSFALVLVLVATVGLVTGCRRTSVLVVGLDGANWAVLDPLIEAGYLPTIAALVHDGARAEMTCVPADPRSACFCPPVWTSIATGRPLVQHRIANFETPSDQRGVVAIWNVAKRYGVDVTLSSWRGTWPPEPDVDYVFTEPGNDELAEEHYVTWQLGTHVGRSQPETLFQPTDLPEALGLRPYPGPRPDSWGILARDRVAMRGLLELVLRLQDVASHEPHRELTMILLHGGDKVSHLMWGGLQDEMWGPVHTDGLLADAARWDGPIELGPPWGWGTIAGAYVEADLWLGRLLAGKHYDYVVLVSDHGMTRSFVGFPGGHGPDDVEAHDGIFSIAGPGVVGGARLEKTSVLDVAPTLAYALGMPVARDLPGRILTEAFTEEHLTRFPVVTIASWEASGRGFGRAAH